MYLTRESETGNGFIHRFFSSSFCFTAYEVAYWQLSFCMKFHGFSSWLHSPIPCSPLFLMAKVYIFNTHVHYNCTITHLPTHHHSLNLKLFINMFAIGVDSLKWWWVYAPWNLRLRAWEWPGKCPPHPPKTMVSYFSEKNWICLKCCAAMENTGVGEGRQLRHFHLALTAEIKLLSG